LDSKNPAMQTLIADAPKMLDYLDDVALQHFEGLKKILDAAKINYVINPRLVRGLDYYGLTVFEWVTQELGAQGTVCAGGRYDQLVELLGGKPTPAVGFACGLERLVLLLEQKQQCAQNPDIYMILLGGEAVQKGLVFAETIRDQFPEIKIETNLSLGNIKNQFKRADKSGAEWAVIIGEEEIINQKVILKNLRADQAQQIMSEDQLIQFLKNRSV
jgi:histidyl-tRNA synthetase